MTLLTRTDSTAPVSPVLGAVPPHGAPRPLPWRAWVLAVAVGLGLVAHGCHGADVDHEPAVAVPVERR